MEGIERMIDISRDSGVAIILLICFALIVVGYMLGGPVHSFRLSLLFSIKERPSIFSKAGTYDQLINRLFNVQFILSLGIFATIFFRHILNHPFEEGHFFYMSLLFSLIFSVYYILWINVVRIVGNLFLPESDVRMWLRDHLILSGEMGIVLFITTITMIYIRGIESIGIYIGLFVVISLKVIAIYKGVRLFFSNLYSWFYLILYLCALEMIPIVLLYKSIIFLIA